MHKSILAVCAAVMLLLSAGCGQTATAAGQSSAQSAEAAQTIYGKIKEINGNELLLAIGEYSQSVPDAAQGGSPQEEGSMPTDGSRTGAGGDKQSGLPSGGQGGSERTGTPPDASVDAAASSADTAPTGDFSISSGAGGGSRGNRQGGMGGGMSMGQFTLSGEEETYLIPVTATITTGRGDSAKTVSFTQLAVKNVVSISLDKDGQIIAVVVLQ